jgi:hypothetical protein
VRARVEIDRANAIENGAQDPSHRTAVERSADRRPQRHISRLKMQGVHKNDTCILFTKFSQQRPASNVHKNETPAKPVRDSLPAG